MINPKNFYRKLDALINDIYQMEGIDTLQTVLKELIVFLGSELHIAGGQLYEENDEDFLLIYFTINNHYEESLRKDDPAVKLIVKHFCYIFNEPKDLIGSVLQQHDGHIPAACLVYDEEKRWILIFELEAGWQREEVELSLNIVQKILNSKFSSKHFKNYILQAELIQRSLLPKEFPKIEGFEIAGRSIPAEIVGGDLYDVQVHDAEHISIAIGDASGHGLTAALLVRDVVTGLRMGLEKHLKITYALEKLNRVIHQSRLSTSFVSLFYAEIEANGNLIYVNAGHPSPLLFRQNKIEEFPVGGLILGPLPEVRLRRGFKELVKGDLIVLYSDGLIERENKYGKAFEKRRLINIILERRDLTAAELVEAIIRSAFEFGNHAKWEDDVTVLAIRKLTSSIYDHRRELPGI